MDKSGLHLNHNPEPISLIQIKKGRKGYLALPFRKMSLTRPIIKYNVCLGSGNGSGGSATKDPFPIQCLRTK